LSGINQSTVKVTLRNPLDKTDFLDYYIIPNDTQLAKDWIIALEKLLKSNNLLEKNFCFMGFPKTARTLSYLCRELNQAVFQINIFNTTRIWETHGLKSFIIEDYYTEDSVRFGSEYPIAIGGNDVNQLGLNIKHDVMNRLHNYFEHLQGTVNNLSPYYKLADYETKYAIRQLNILCHEIENLVLSQRKLISAPEWQRPSQITTFLHADRYILTDDHRLGFITNGYDRKFGSVYMHWAQIGKTLFEVFRDENAPQLSATSCDAITHLEYYSGEFDVEWAMDIVHGGTYPWHDKEQDAFRAWLIDNKLDPADPKLSLGYLPIGEIDLKTSFGTTDPFEIWDMLSDHLDIYSVEINGTRTIFDYCWNDKNYKQQQIDMMRVGYDHSSSRG
jgi:hypothetical protein